MTVPRLCLVADGFASGRPELDADAVAARTLDLVAAGVPWVALRDTAASETAFERAAGRLAERLRALRPDVVLSVHGRPEAARRLGAVYHATTSGGATVAEAVAAGLAAGASVHSATAAVRAARDGAAYVFFSPVFATRTHPERPPAGIGALRLCAERAGVPVVALGGMSPPRARIARTAGAHGAAALAGLLFAWAPATTVLAFLRAVEPEAVGPSASDGQPVSAPSTPAMPVPTALTIAGSDSGGGAGLQADLKAFEAHGVFGMSVVTALTAQNTREVTAIHAVPPAFIAQQLDAVASDLPIGAVKTGMLATAEIVEAVADGIARWRLMPVVVDPVMVSKGGSALLTPDAVEAVRRRMLGLAALVTPNAHEAAALAGFPVRTLADARRAADRILAPPSAGGPGPAAVLVKGGHLDGEADAVDLLVTAAGEAFTFRLPRLDTVHTHGTGCTYASAIAARLARGEGLVEAVARARGFLHEAIRHAPGLGHGHGPTRPFWFLSGAEAGRYPAVATAQTTRTER